MKEIKVSVNTWYVVEGTAGATVTNPSTNRVIATLEEGKQASFYATTPYVLASDDSVSVYKATFKSAPAALMALGLLGGGSSSGGGGVLPAGYLAAEFLESNGMQSIATGIDANSMAGFCIGYVPVNLPPYFFDVLGCRVASGAASYGLIAKKQSDTDLSFRFDYGARGTQHTYTASVGKLLEIAFDPQNGKFKINEAEYNVAGATFNLPSKFYLGLLGGTTSGSPIYGRILGFEYGYYLKYVPAVNEQGRPCMFDTVSNQPFFNSGSGQFVVGMNMKQALKLSKLPAGGGSLTVSLPTGYESDAGVMTALETARSNGWTLTVQTYEAEAAAASTFGMRRIWVRKQQNAHGSYVDADDTRYTVDWCVEMYTPDGSTPDMHGYELFRSQESAVEYWGLTPYVDPEVEKLMQEEHLTEYNANE